MTEATTRPRVADWQEATRILTEEILEHGHAVTGWWVGQQVLLLTTTGARTGAERTHPLAYTRDGDSFIVTASKGGAPTHPGWFFNLLNDPIATIDLERETFRVRARVADDTERQRLWDQHVTVHRQIGEYPKKTDRVIPVVVLERIDDRTGS